MYIKTNWLDRIVQYPRRYIDNLSVVRTFTPNEGTITEAGTPFSATGMNIIENGIASATYTNSDMMSIDRRCRQTITYDIDNNIETILEEIDAIFFGWITNKLTTFTYDVNNNLETINVKVSSLGTPLNEWTDTIAYDGNDNIISITRAIIL